MHKLANDSWMSCLYGEETSLLWHSLL